MSRHVSIVVDHISISKENPFPLKVNYVEHARNPTILKKFVLQASLKVPGDVVAKSREQRSTRTIQAIQSGPNTDKSTSEFSEDEILCGVNSFQSCSSNPPKTRVKIGKCKIDVIVDTGASINILHTLTFNKIQRQNWISIIAIPVIYFHMLQTHQ